MGAQKKQLIGLVVVLVVFVAAFFGLRAWQDHQKEQEEAEQKAEIITAVSLDVDRITGFSYLLEGQELSFEKVEDTWQYSGDTSVPLIQTMITTMLGSLSEVTAAQQITAPENTDEYGFADPLNVIKVQFGEEEMTFTIGMYNSITSQYYLMVSGDQNVYLVDGQISSAFTKSVEDLMEKEEEE